MGTQPHPVVLGERRAQGASQSPTACPPRASTPCPRVPIGQLMQKPPAPAALCGRPGRSSFVGWLMVPPGASWPWAPLQGLGMAPTTRVCAARVVWCPGLLWVPGACPPPGEPGGGWEPREGPLHPIGLWDKQFGGHLVAIPAGGGGGGVDWELHTREPPTIVCPAALWALNSRKP